MKKHWTILGLLIFVWLGQGCGSGYAKGPYLYVLSNQNIVEIDTSTNKVTYEVPAELTDSRGNTQYPAQAAVTPDGNFVYLVYGRNLIAVLNSKTHTLTKIGDLTNIYSVNFGLEGISSSPDGKYVYFDGYPYASEPCSPGAGFIFVVNTKTNVISQLSNTNIACPSGGMAISPNGESLYLTGGVGLPAGFVSAVSVMTGTTTTISLTNAGAQGVAVTPNGKLVYAAGTSYGSSPPLSAGLFVIDAKKFAVSQIINIQNGQWIVVSPDGETAYETTGTSVVEINLDNNQVGQSVNINGAGHLAVTPDGETLYILGTNGITVLNTSNNKTVTTIPITGVDLAIQSQ
jgi:DNA-binding beta-propeller fold protein YncE